MMLFISILLDAAVIFFHMSYLYLAVTTVLAYYIWFIIGSFQFPEIHIVKKDYAFISSFIILHILLLKFNKLNDYFGLFFGIIICIFLGKTFYNKSMLKIFIQIENINKILFDKLASKFN